MDVDFLNSLKRSVTFSPWAVVSILMLTLCTAALNCTYHGQVADQLDRIEREEIEMLTTKWISDGKERSWTTTQRENESIEDMLVRHEAALAALMKKYPEDPAN